MGPDRRTLGHGSPAQMVEILLDPLRLEDAEGLLELAIEEVRQSAHGLLFVRTLGDYAELGVVSRTQGYDSHDRLPVDFQAILFDGHLRIKSIGSFDQQGSRPCMKPQSIPS